MRVKTGACGPRAECGEQEKEHLQAAGPPGTLLMSKASRGPRAPGVAITGAPRGSRRDAGMFITGA